MFVLWLFVMLKVFVGVELSDVALMLSVPSMLMFLCCVSCFLVD